MEEPLERHGLIFAIVKIQTGDYAAAEGRAESPKAKNPWQGFGSNRRWRSVAAGVREVDGADKRDRH